MEILHEPDILLDPPELPEIPLPKNWTQHTLLAVLHVIALARIVVMNVANWPIDAECDGLRLRTENDRLRGEIEMLKDLPGFAVRAAHIYRAFYDDFNDRRNRAFCFPNSFSVCHSRFRFSY